MIAVTAHRGRGRRRLCRRGETRQQLGDSKKCDFRVPTGLDWLFEIKWDEFRSLAFIGRRISNEKSRPDWVRAASAWGPLDQKLMQTDGPARSLSEFPPASRAVACNRHSSDQSKKAHRQADLSGAPVVMVATLPHQRKLQWANCTPDLGAGYTKIRSILPTLVAFVGAS